MTKTIELTKEFWEAEANRLRGELLNIVDYKLPPHLDKLPKAQRWYHIAAGVSERALAATARNTLNIKEGKVRTLDGKTVIYASPKQSQQRRRVGAAHKVAAGTKLVRARAAKR